MREIRSLGARWRGLETGSRLKSARWVRGGGGWKRAHGSVSEALPEETGSQQIGGTYGAPRQSSTLQHDGGPRCGPHIHGSNRRHRQVIPGAGLLTRRAFPNLRAPE